MKRALILGAGGQDGAYLTKYLLFLGYEVYAMVSTTEKIPSNHKYLGISDYEDRVTYISGDVKDVSQLVFAINHIKPNEIYNLAAQSSVSLSWERPRLTREVNAIGASLVFETAKRYAPDARIFQASSSEMYGCGNRVPQNENTPFDPVNPYGVAKLYAHQTAKLYRDHHGMFIANGILFNHESPLRGEQFVTRKITKAAANIKHRRQDILELGNINVQRDWGHAADYVVAMHAMLQTNDPSDFVIATGKTRSILQFLEVAFSYVGLDFWQYVTVQKDLIRPKEVDTLQGDATKAKEILRWEPQISFTQMVHEMVDRDLKEIANG